MPRSSPDFLTAIARRLPDVPRWVEVRAELLRGKGEIYGWQQEPELSLVFREPDLGTLFVVGTPLIEAVQEAINQNENSSELIAPLAQKAWLSEALPGWTDSQIMLHTLKDHTQLPTSPAGMVDFLDPALLPRLAIPGELRQELTTGAEHSPVAATFVNALPVSFCYAGAITESWWDISIDTLPEYRQKGYAALCVACMIRHLQKQGKQPVWAAVAENPASWRLARKLGFTPVDELVLFTR